MLRKILNTEKYIKVSDAIFPNWQAESLSELYSGVVTITTQRWLPVVCKHMTVLQEKMGGFCFKQMM